MKREIVFQILCFTTFFKDTQFEASSNSQIDKDELLKEENINISNIYNSNKESEEDLSNQDFYKVQRMTLKEIQNLK